MLYISEYTSNRQYVHGTDNPVADALSRVETIGGPTVIDYEELAIAQEGDDQITQLQQSGDAANSVQLKVVSKGVYCNVANGNIRPYVSPTFRKTIFESVGTQYQPSRRENDSQDDFQKILLARYEQRNRKLGKNIHTVPEK